MAKADLGTGSGSEGSVLSTDEAPTTRDDELDAALDDVEEGRPEAQSKQHNGASVRNRVAAERHWGSQGSQLTGTAV